MEWTAVLRVYVAIRGLRNLWRLSFFVIKLSCQFSVSANCYDKIFQWRSQECSTGGRGHVPSLPSRVSVGLLQFESLQTFAHN